MQQTSPILLAFSGLTLMACFSVQEVDVSASASSPRLILDDFEDGNSVPTNDLFDNWDCYQFNSEPAVPVCSFVAGADSNLAYSLKFDLSGPAVPSDNGIGAGMTLWRQAGTVDLSQYQRLHANAKVDAGSPPLPVSARFEIAVVCTTVNRGSGSGTWLPMVVEDYTILSEFPSPNDWRSLTVALHELMPPDWLKTQDPSAADCLKVVDFVHFEVSSPFDVNQHATGSLTIDDVWLE
jgi:hypothetical protein